jgi:hypothetical protein
MSSENFRDVLRPKTSKKGTMLKKYVNRKLSLREKFLFSCRGLPSSFFDAESSFLKFISRLNRLGGNCFLISDDIKA